MTTQPLVTIVTPSYQQADYLEATLQSVLTQDYPNIEYIVIDGGSTDGSIEIIERYADQLTYWVSEPDEGQSSAINKGLMRAKGEIVAWLNSDDIYLPGAIARAVEALHAHPDTGMVYGNLQSVDAAGRVFNTITYKQYNLADLLALRIIGQPTVFMRRSVLEQAGPLNISYQYLMDHNLWVRMAMHAEMVYLPETWAAARHHPAAKNTALSAGFGEEAYRILRWAEERPELIDIMQEQKKRIWGGAYRFDARYLLDGRFPAKALAVYWRALRHDPGYALKHWHRILYALFSLLGLGGLRKWMRRNR